MRAAVCHEFGKPLVVESVKIDPPQIGEVKVRMVATAICHSDIHILRGEWEAILPSFRGTRLLESLNLWVKVLPWLSRVITLWFLY